jgi:hypothetical protein
MKYYHGTTEENAKRILSGKNKVNSTWKVSDDKYLYLYSPESLCENGECNEEDMHDFTIRRCFEQAQITAAISKKPVKKLVVLCFEFDPENDNVEPDYSCQNMQGAFCVSDLVYKDYLVEKFVCGHDCRFDVFTLRGLMNHKLFHTEKIDRSMKLACEAIEHVIYDLCDIVEFDYKKVSI